MDNFYFRRFAILLVTTISGWTAALARYAGDVIGWRDQLLRPCLRARAAQPAVVPPRTGPCLAPAAAPAMPRPAVGRPLHYSATGLLGERDARL